VAITIILLGSSLGFFGLYALSFSAFIGGILTAFIIFKLAKFGGHFSTTYMLLAGIAINALAGAATGFLTYLSNDQQLRTLTFWLMGNLGTATWNSFFVVASITFPAMLILFKNSKNLDIFLLGEDEAKYLGINVKKLKILVLSFASLLVAVCVSFSGIIGFVSLVVPHLIRLMIGPNNKILIPLSAILGAILLLISDTIARTINAPAEIPVGIITSLIGAPFFLWLLIKQFKGGSFYD
jgi:iron complex transport system permease protein